MNVGFFLEVVLGGLMAGVLYSLVALGFVLIFKASGVFNYAQGAMVLFAALSLARLAEWLPLWFPFLAPVAVPLAFILAVLIMIALAWAIERIVLRPLVNQDGIVLLMATLGVTFFLDGFGQTIWGSNIYNIDLGIPKEPLLLFESVFQGGIQLNRDDLVAAVGGCAGGGIGAVLSKDRYGPRLACGRRRPPSGAVDRHSLESYLGHRLVGRGLCGARGRHGLG